MAHGNRERLQSLVTFLDQSDNHEGDQARVEQLELGLRLLIEGNHHPQRKG